ncbi:2-amino-4-hydroxy-6-hydroxymethyldihydropteridine diphosphokinase [Paenirhodobacter sp.]|uniref:2-amino-4-hydroxy-6- hydroxymethyldihydropteridine diphosphokinase n=1 Tax=Paenirhodobacter sp. TaxID=1965326 RepID=UPI003B40447B
MGNIILIALGANLPSSFGFPARTIAAALERLSAEGLSVLAASRFYRSPAFPAGSGPDYVNACARIAAPGMAAGAVLDALHRVEGDFGRVRSGRWQARGIDLDLIAFGQEVLPGPEGWRHWAALPPERQLQEAPQQPIVPHPRMHERGFVLIPLAEIAPGWRHPVLGQTVAELADMLPEAEKRALVPLDAPFSED